MFVSSKNANISFVQVAMLFPAISAIFDFVYTIERDFMERLLRVICISCHAFFSSFSCFVTSPFQNLGGSKIFPEHSNKGKIDLTISGLFCARALCLNDHFFWNRKA